MDRQMVLDHLALAEQHIADGKTTIERQQTLIPELERGRPRNYAVSGAFEPILTNPKDARGGSKTAAPRTRKIGCWKAKTPVLSSAHPATPADWPQRQTGELHMRPGEWDAHNGYGQHDRCDEMTEREPPTGED